jgi:hypothetical protein
LSQFQATLVGGFAGAGNRLAAPPSRRVDPHLHFTWGKRNWGCQYFGLFELGEADMSRIARVIGASLPLQ